MVYAASKPKLPQELSPYRDAYFEELQINPRGYGEHHGLEGREKLKICFVAVAAGLSDQEGWCQEFVDAENSYAESVGSKKTSVKEIISYLKSVAQKPLYPEASMN